MIKAADDPSTARALVLFKHSLRSRNGHRPAGPGRTKVLAVAPAGRSIGGGPAPSSPIPQAGESLNRGGPVTPHATSR